MNSHPIVLLNPIFKWLDWIIAEYGLYLYMVAIFLAPLVFAWILSGGFWRRRASHRRASHLSKRTRLPVAPPAIPSNSYDDNTPSFSA